MRVLKSRGLGLLGALALLTGCAMPFGGARDYERPDIFAVADTGGWDGRPSLGGVWVAHPDVTTPERVLIRNDETQSAVVGALFARDNTPQDPLLMVSSDAAAALEMTAGAPATLRVVALRDAPAGPAQTASLEKPFIQVGIFHVKSNATRTAQRLRDAGLLPGVLKQNPRGTPFWRVVVGPAESREARAMLLTVVQQSGFADAYPVTH